MTPVIGSGMDHPLVCPNCTFDVKCHEEKRKFGGNIKMFSVRQLLVGFSLMLGYLISAQADDLSLNGVASYKSLGQEKFIAALYLAAPTSSPATIYAANSPKRMEIRLTSSYSKRRWVNLWMQGMAINNSSSAFSDMADALVAMFDAQSGGLKANDIVTISFEPKSGCSYRINGVELVKDLPPGLFELFLSTWIGNVPPSGEFRDAILGNSPNDYLAARLASLEPSADRKTVIEGWKNAEPKEKTSLAQVEAKKTAADTSQKPQPAPKPAAKPTPAEQKPEQVATRDNPKAAASKPASSAQDDGELPPDVVPLFTAVEEDPTQTALANVPDLPQEAEEEEENATVSVDMILAIREYTQSVIRQMYKSIRYPDSAQRRGHEGGVRLLVRIDRSGELVDIETAEESEHRSLNKAATSAAKRASPFPPVPDIISDDPLEITVPISFKLR